MTDQQIDQQVPNPKYFGFSRVFLNKDCSLVNKTEIFENYFGRKDYSSLQVSPKFVQTQRHKKASLLQVELHILSIEECTFCSPRFTLRALAKHNGDKPRFKKNARGAQNLSYQVNG